MSGEEIVLNGDRSQWEVVFENIIQNALRYAESYIDITCEKSEGKTLMIIHNDGDPIPEESLERLFEPFQKSHKGQFGLGLAIVKRIVELHNGTVEVQNNENGVSIIIVI